MGSFHVLELGEPDFEKAACSIYDGLERYLQVLPSQQLKPEGLWEAMVRLQLLHPPQGYESLMSDWDGALRCRFRRLNVLRVAVAKKELFYEPWFVCVAQVRLPLDTKRLEGTLNSILSW